MNGVGFEILARTPVPKLPLSYRYLPPPHTEAKPHSVCPQSTMHIRIHICSLTDFVVTQFIYGSAREI